MEQLEVQNPVVKKQLLDVQPRELKFILEVKKQSSCAVHLANLSDHYVAFKVKTTSPKKYCVRPNIGVIKPKSTYDFTVTMQAQKSAPSDMQCKDKFLVQSTVAPFGTTEEDITPDLFAKDSGKYVEECKLKVSLTSPTQSPVLSPVNGASKLEQSPASEISEEKLLTRVENLPPLQMLDEKFESEKLVMDAEVLTSAKVEENVLLPTKTGKLICDRDVEYRPLDVVDGTKLKFSRDVEELKSKLITLDSELIQVKSNITKLTEEKSCAVQEKQTLKRELATLRRKTSVRTVERGFPPLFVCMVALISLTVGYLLHG
ncbi:vesicle-associated protein 1-1-like [Coffea eugenioides]|uniref:vesicle-associated protein 1-1-like n=1 Tax=Coffea eugenioides TaxID=49369 RepID=UPI000F5CCA16|nr:vesicle-associated protein 1-1-like [Coffea arabica]XP_027119650.1 vesicle-associated protein 1-1-like [Coffea arabica]XP_027119651.1 vesicle-associated protein 1-1-like [Coffea arabica]XP_027119652.1 vesicle-associated protein 1-1-like [Coffea arabica]XP_027119653.1 vesicle-associated protein 1-1-like [Coffea arabica]XP_027119654.1 vesicle-associated protein 1-1-like [Coffea arabica]XP_027165540.1 vesicle-associated protein 1-1-like [Coffea eugenioides]XP_027165541.1 vesicle-associated p